MTIRAVVHQAEEGGFWAEVPALPGCMTQGEDLDELKARLKEAVELWFEAGNPDKTTVDGQILELAI